MQPAPTLENHAKRSLNDSTARHGVGCSLSVHNVHIPNGASARQFGLAPPTRKGHAGARAIGEGLSIPVQAAALHRSAVDSPAPIPARIGIREASDDLRNPLAPSCRNFRRGFFRRRRNTYRGAGAKVQGSLGEDARWPHHFRASPNGPEILFIHGFSQSHLSWIKQVTNSELAKEFHMVTYDLRGHGNSDKPLEPERYKTGKYWADELQAVMDATGLQRPVLAGWSYGGRIMADYLTTHGTAKLAGLNYVDAGQKGDPSFFGPNLRNLPLMASENLAINIAATRGTTASPSSRPKRNTKPCSPST